MDTPSIGHRKPQSKRGRPTFYRGRRRVSIRTGPSWSGVEAKPLRLRALAIVAGLLVALGALFGIGGPAQSAQSTGTARPVVAQATRHPRPTSAPSSSPTTRRPRPTATVGLIPPSTVTRAPQANAEASLTAWQWNAIAAGVGGLLALLVVVLVLIHLRRVNRQVSRDANPDSNHNGRAGSRFDQRD